MMQPISKQWGDEPRVHGSKVEELVTGFKPQQTQHITGGLRQRGSGMIFILIPRHQTPLICVVAHMGGASDGNGIKKLGTPVNIEIAGNLMFIPADVIGFQHVPSLTETSNLYFYRGGDDAISCKIHATRIGNISNHHH